MYLTPHTSHLTTHILSVVQPRLITLKSYTSLVHTNYSIIYYSCVVCSSIHKPGLALCHTIKMSEKLKYGTIWLM